MSGTDIHSAHTNIMPITTWRCSVAYTSSCCRTRQYPVPHSHASKGIGAARSQRHNSHASTASAGKSTSRPRFVRK